MITVEKSASSRAKCRLCNTRIEDEYRIAFSYKSLYNESYEYYHIECILKLIRKSRGKPEDLVSCPNCKSTYDYEIDGVYFGSGDAGIQMKCKCGEVFQIKPI